MSAKSAKAIAEKWTIEQCQSFLKENPKWYCPEKHAIEAVLRRKIKEAGK